MTNINDLMNEVVSCKKCGKATLYGELIWLEGNCMCPRCYQAERARKDKEEELLMSYPKIRKLDGVYFRVQRNGKWVNVCFTDLTEEEQETKIGKWDNDQLQRLALILATRLRAVGDQFNLCREEE